MNIQLIDCPACGSKVSSQAAACPHCGQPVRPIPKGNSPQGRQTSGMTNCPHCRKSVPEGTKWCPECGRRLSGPIPWYGWLLFIGVGLKCISDLIKAGVI